MILLASLFSCIADFPVRNFPPVIEQILPAADSVVNIQDNTLFTIDVSDLIPVTLGEVRSWRVPS